MPVDVQPHPAHTHQAGRYCLFRIPSSPPPMPPVQERAQLEHSADGLVIPPFPISTSSCFAET